MTADRTTTDSAVGMKAPEGGRNALKTPPHEAVERLGAAEITGRRTWGGIDGSGHEDLTTVRHDDLRTVLSHLRQVEEREAVKDRALAPFAKAADGFETWVDCQTLGVAVTWKEQHFTVGDLRRAKEAAALTHSPETDGEAS